MYRPVCCLVALWCDSMPWHMSIVEVRYNFHHNEPYWHNILRSPFLEYNNTCKYINVLVNSLPIPLPFHTHIMHTDIHVHFHTHIPTCTCTHTCTHTLLYTQSQISFDVAWSPNCIDGRCYQYAELALVTDYLVVMSYDERSQIYGPCVAGANSGYNTTTTGILQYRTLGLNTTQLILGVPWYGYNYPCLSLSDDHVCSIDKVPFRGADCSDAAGRHVGLRVCNVRWSAIISAP
jgi:hypothetical protein